MRDELGVLLVEDSDGVSVQLFADPAAAAGTFEELKGRPGEPRRRATFLGLRWTDTPAGLRFEVYNSQARDIPVPLAQQPDSWVLGEGPRKEA